MDSGKWNALSLEECVDGDSTIDINNQSHEVEPQQDSDQESWHLAGQLRVKEDMIMKSIRDIDDTHAMVAEYCWRTFMEHDSSDGEIFLDDFHTLRERVTVMRTDYQQLLLEVGDMYHRELREKETKVD